MKEKGNIKGTLISEACNDNKHDTYHTCLKQRWLIYIKIKTRISFVFKSYFQNCIIIISEQNYNLGVDDLSYLAYTQRTLCCACDNSQLSVF